MRLLIAGAGGLVGGLVLQLALNDKRISQIVSLGRRDLTLSHPKLQQLRVAFDALPAGLGSFDAAICTLGTTIRKAGSQAAFRAVDVDAVLAFAKAAKMAGVQSFSTVTSAGADAASGNFYLATKGEVEAALAAIGFSSLTILRPGLLIGPRAERRPMERLMIALSPVLVDPLLIGSLRRYRSLPADTVARALLNAAQKTAPGQHVLEHDAIRALAGSV